MRRGIALLALPVLAAVLMAVGPTTRPYLLKTCIVSGEKLGMDTNEPPIVMIYKDREIKFCCKDCVEEFHKNPDKYIKKLEKAEAAAGPATQPAK